MVRKVFIALVLCSIVSCKHSISNEDLSKKMVKTMLEYDNSNDKKLLSKLYSDLEKNEDFNHHRLNINILIPTIRVLTELHKYDEAITHISNNPKIDEYAKKKMINSIEYHKYRFTDIEKAKQYLKNNLLFIKDEIKKNPQDTLLYSEYFALKLELIDEENTMKEIDSLFPSNSKYREIFKEMIKDYYR